MFHRIVGAQHFLLQADSSEQLAGFAGHRFADMEAWKRFLFEHDWLDAFPEKEHCCRRAPGSAANYEHIGFHLHQGADDNKKTLASKEDFHFSRLRQTSSDSSRANYDSLQAESPEERRDSRSKVSFA